MTKIEIFLAVLGNLHELAQIALAAGLVALFAYTIFCGFNQDTAYSDLDKARCKTLWSNWRKLVGITAVLSLFVCIPTMDDIWRVRIALIKFELASPETVKKGADEIARLVQKLECKYLGCAEESKK